MYDDMISPRFKLSDSVNVYYAFKEWKKNQQKQNMTCWHVPLCFAGAADMQLDRGLEFLLSR